MHIICKESHRFLEFLETVGSFLSVGIFVVYCNRYKVMISFFYNSFAIRIGFLRFIQKLSNGIERD